MRATHVFRLFSMDTGREYVYTILQFKVQIRLFHTKKMQIILYSNLEKIPYFQGKDKNKISYESYRKTEKKKDATCKRFHVLPLFFSVSAWL